MDMSDRDFDDLRQLEEGLWRSDVRFNIQRMEEVLAPDFFEFGRSSRTYSRAETLAVPAQEIDAVIPLRDFKVRPLNPDVAQVTYESEATYPSGKQRALRSSIWIRSSSGWRLIFHQGTPIPDSA
ncbi:MAG: DUF4440 domain-containing protein [Chloroflexi bacterium]|nr:DUF4440 domain-containing protein [Chloroflexota bacterium]